MIEKKFQMIGMVGLVAPPIIYFLFFGLYSTAFSVIGLSGSGMLASVAIISILIWCYSAGFARSANKFFKKRENGDFKTLFGINSIAAITPLMIYLFGNSTMGIANVFLLVALVYIAMFIVGNAIRIWLTSIIFSVDIKTSMNAHKFVLIFEIVCYSFFIFIALTMAGAF